MMYARLVGSEPPICVVLLPRPVSTVTMPSWVRYQPCTFRSSLVVMLSLVQMLGSRFIVIAPMLCHERRPASSCHRSSWGLSWFSRAAEARSGPFAEPGDHPFDALLPFRSPDFGAGLQSPNHCSIVVAEGAPNPEIVKGPVVLL